MNRLFKVLIAGVIALAAYTATYIITASNPATWQVFDSCTDIAAILCLLAGGLTIVATLLFIGLPAAVIGSALCLKQFKFSTSQAVLISITANILTLSIIAAAWFIALPVLPTWAMAAILVMSYPTVTLVWRSPQLRTP